MKKTFRVAKIQASRQIEQIMKERKPNFKWHIEDTHFGELIVVKNGYWINDKNLFGIHIIMKSIIIYKDGKGLIDIAENLATEFGYDIQEDYE